MGSASNKQHNNSGDGSFTAKVLRRYLPSDLQLLLGADKSEVMVRYARERYQAGPVQFQQLEIGKPLPSEYIGIFDHIFSFFDIRRHKVLDNNIVFIFRI